MAGMMDFVMIGVLAVGAYFVWTNKDTLFAPGGGFLGGGGDTTNVYADDGSSAANVSGEATAGCCHCKIVAGRAKCEKNGDGAWWNPPAGSGGSNDQDVVASAKSCASSQCGAAAATAAKPATTSTPNKPSTGNLGEKGTVYAKTPSNTGGASPRYSCTSGLCATATGRATAACSHCPKPAVKAAAKPPVKTYPCSGLCCSTAIATAACSQCRAKGKCAAGTYGAQKYGAYTQRVAFMTNTYKGIYPRMSV